MKYLLTISIALFFITLACGRKVPPDEGRKISDPYTESFWGKNIKSMIRKNSFGSDTLFFDQSGNLIEEQSLGGSVWKAEFDNNHFPMRIRIGEDMPEHNLISYQIVENIVIQKWVSIRTLNWHYKQEDIDPLKASYSVFIFNDDGYLIKEINLKENRTVEYIYSDGILSQRIDYDQRLEMKNKTQKYFYKNSIIEKIENYYHGANKDVPDVIDYFNKKGILDSSQYITSQGKIGLTRNYNYTYY